MFQRLQCLSLWCHCRRSSFGTVFVTKAFLGVRLWKSRKAVALNLSVIFWLMSDWNHRVSRFWHVLTSQLTQTLDQDLSTKTHSHTCSLFDSSVWESRNFCVFRKLSCLIVLRYRASESETAVQKVLKIKKNEGGGWYEPSSDWALYPSLLGLCLLGPHWQHTGVNHHYLHSQTLPKALRTQALTALTSNFGLVGLVW